MSRVVAYLIIAFTLITFGCAEDPKSDLIATHLRCESLVDPMGIDAIQPRLSWILEGTKKAQSQTKYRIIVSSTEKLIEEGLGDLWDSDEVESSESINIKFSGKDLNSRESCFWKVKVWDQDSVESGWSAVRRWSMGLLSPGDWTAEWIGYDAAWQDSSIQTKPYANGMKPTHQYKPLPCPFLRNDFTIDQPFESATCYVTALGLYELYVNGERVGSDHFSPGWSDYRKRIYYRTYDVGPLLKSGENSIAAILADGWYAGNVANLGQYKYGKHLRLKAQVETKRAGETTVVVLTDGDWKASYGPIREADMQGGETHDARLEMNGWSNVGFDDSEWLQVVVDDSSTAPLESYPGETVRRMQEIKPVSVFETKPGVFIADMGQNFAGWARLKVNGNPGDSIVLRFGEKLNADNSLHTRNLRTARCTDTYVLNGKGEETWEPKFSYHGYQYVEITGFNGTVTSDDITGIVAHSDLSNTGTFECSDDLVNRIQQNILWSQRSNFFEVPTDCPQRDERMGWAGDAQLFLPAAAYNMDVASFYSKWLVALRDGQFENGRIPSTGPKVYYRVAAGWGDAVIICPWEIYNLYNDQKILEDSYESMTQWVEYLENKQEGLINKQLTYGDWQNADSETPLYLISAAYFKHSVDLLSKIASVLGKTNDVRKYNQLSSDIKEAFINEFVSDSALLEGNTQTGYLMALSFDLLPDSMVTLAQNRLLDLIVENDYQLTTGILGTPLLLPTLTDMGEVDLAYRLLQSRDYPSLGFQIDNGANTIWERWDGYSEKAGFHKDSTNSLNHFAFGSVGEWFYSSIAGIRNLGAGYKTFEIRPRIGGGLMHAKASFASIRGTIVSEWAFDEAGFTLNVTIPANTTARVYLPLLQNADSDKTKELAELEGATVLVENRQEVILNVPSGNYTFRVPLN